MKRSIRRLGLTVVFLSCLSLAPASTQGEDRVTRIFTFMDKNKEFGDQTAIFRELTDRSRNDKGTLYIPTTKTEPLSYERCVEAPVDVTTASSDERTLACSAAGGAVQLLSRCQIYLRKPLHVEIASQVLHPLSKGALGFFDAKRERVVVAQFANVPSLIRGTPYGELPPRDFYKSLIVHELVHAIMHQNYERQPMTRAAYEYPAYALQIESLPADVRDKFLQSMNAGADDLLFNDVVLAADPFYFAARAYEHFRTSANPCAHLIALLKGEVAFIPTLPELSP